MPRSLCRPGVHCKSQSSIFDLRARIAPVWGIEIEPAIYPSSKTLYLEAIKEQVPVFEGKFRITEDVTVTFSKVRDGFRSLVSAGKTILITGELKYQACDKTVFPTSVPVKWQVQVLPIDLKRSRKPKQVTTKNSEYLL